MPMILDPLQESDDVPRPLYLGAKFFAECHPLSYALGGAEADIAPGTLVTVAARLSGRMLLKTPDGWFRWASIDYLIRPKK